MTEFLWAYANSARNGDMTKFKSGFVMATSKKIALEACLSHAKFGSFPLTLGFVDHESKVVKIPASRIKNGLYSLMICAVSSNNDVCFKVTWAYAQSLEEAIGKGMLRGWSQFFPINKGYYDHGCTAYKLPRGVIKQLTCKYPNRVVEYPKAI